MDTVSHFIYTCSVIAMAASGAAAQTAPSNAATQPQPGASADAAAPQSAPQTQPASAADALGEIIVTAQQRGENLQKAAVAVDVVKGSELIASGVTDLSTLSKLVPALTIQGTSNGNLIFIRGVGNFTFQPSSDPATAFNYDGVYIGRPTSNAGVFYDLQRIEVLKGPQGTLYGRNATAGAINVLPVQPQIGSLAGYGTVSYGNYNSVTAEGALNAPIGGSFAVRVSGSYDRHDPYLADRTSSDSSGGARVQLKGEITPDVTIRLSGDYAHQGGTGTGVNYIEKYALDPATQQYTFAPSNISPSQGVFTPDSQAFRQTVTAGTAGRKLGPLVNFPFEDNSFYGTHVQLDVKTSIGTFTVLPAYRHADKHNLNAAGFIIADTQGSDQYSIEARLVSDPGKLIDYNFGVYYFAENVDDRQSATVQSLASFTNSRYQTRSPAVYGRLTLHATDRLRLTGGARYTADDKNFTSATQSVAVVCVSPTGCPNAPLLPYTTTFAQQPYIPAASGAVLPVGPGTLIVRSDTGAAAKLSSEKVTYRGAVEFDLAPRSLAYASVETGYRSGGFNTAAGFLTFAPETITAYSLGLKNRFFDNRLQLNVEAFDWQYRDQQLSTLGADANGRPAVITQNIGRSTIRGVEVQGELLLAPRTILSADVQYLDAHYKSYSYLSPASGGYPLTGCAVTRDPTRPLYAVDCTGKELYNSPKWTINAGLQHTVELNAYDLTFSVNTQFKSPHYAAQEYLSAEHLGTTTVTDAQIALSPKSEHWSAALFVHNLENTRLLVYANPSIQSNLLVGALRPDRCFRKRASVNVP